MRPFDFGEIEALQQAGRWDEATAPPIGAAHRLERGGADFVVICTDTMHRMADDGQAAIGIPPSRGVAPACAERLRPSQ